MELEPVAVTLMIMPEDIEPQNDQAQPQTADAGDRAGETAPVTPVADEAAQARRERDDYYDRLLRKTAEFDNYRRRVERERREMAQYAAGDLLEALLPVVDDFERALQVEAGEEAAAYRKGVELIYKQFQDLLARRGLTPIDTVGKMFDPRFHQAITYESSPGKAEGEVIEEVRRGYMHGDRLLRPAMVKVAKA
jgi:molecular chaperone GrpE